MGTKEIILSAALATAGGSATATPAMMENPDPLQRPGATQEYKHQEQMVLAQMAAKTPEPRTTRSIHCGEIFTAACAAYKKDGTIVNPDPLQRHGAGKKNTPHGYHKPGCH